VGTRGGGIITERTSVSGEKDIVGACVCVKEGGRERRDREGVRRTRFPWIWGPGKPRGQKAE